MAIGAEISPERTSSLNGQPQLGPLPVAQPANKSRQTLKLNTFAASLIQRWSAKSSTAVA
jgi:hypothetical protein